MAFRLALVLGVAAVWGDCGTDPFKCGGWTPGSPAGQLPCRPIFLPGGMLVNTVRRWRRRWGPDLQLQRCSPRCVPGQVLGLEVVQRAINADSSCSWCVSATLTPTWGGYNITSSSCVMLANATAWIHEKHRWSNSTCAKVPPV